MSPRRVPRGAWVPVSDAGVGPGRGCKGGARDWGTGHPGTFRSTGEPCTGRHVRTGPAPRGNAVREATKPGTGSHGGARVGVARGDGDTRGSPA